MTVEEQEVYVRTRLKEEREKLHLSQMELSYESGVSQNMITYIETGKRTPTLSTILKLCSAMDLNPSLLFPQNTSDKKEAKKIILDLIQQYM